MTTFILNQEKTINYSIMLMKEKGLSVYQLDNTLPLNEVIEEIKYMYRKKMENINENNITSY